MTRTRSRELWFVVVALVVLASTCAWCAKGERFDFVFDPPGGLRGTMSYKYTSKIDMGHGLTKSRSSQGKEALSFTKNKDTYLVSSVPMSYGDNGEPGLVTAAKLLQEAPMTYQLDQFGICTGVFGVDEIINSISKRAAGSASDAVASLRNSRDMMAQMAISDWNEMTSPFSCRSACIGDVWRTSFSRSVPTGGSTTVAAKVKFVGWVRSGGVKWLKIRVDMSCSDLDAMKYYIKQVCSDSYRKRGGNPAGLEIKSLSIKMSNDLLVDPKTMLYLSRIGEDNVKVTAVIPGCGKRNIVVKNRTERKYTYKASAIASR